jgi:putative ABC transport system permease protein
LAKTFPAVYKDTGVRVEPLQKGLFGGFAEVFSLLFVAVGFVLLIACANVANLMLVRGDGRRREMGVRLALGASRRAVIQQLLTESVLLSLAGGLAGLALSFWGIRILKTMSVDLLPMARVSLNGQVLFFTFAICVITGLVFGMVPAYRASKNDPNECMREGGRNTATRSRHRTRNILVVAEMAVALVSLICAGLMINTVTRILHTNPGFDADHLLTAEVRLTAEKYMDTTDVEKTGVNVIRPAVKIFCRQLLERVRAIPGVESAAFADWLPLADDAAHAYSGMTIVGRTIPSEGEPTLILDSVSPGYFQLMSIPIVRGRAIAELDTETSEPVVVINETMARQFWPNEDPIGRAIKFNSSPEERPRRIVGVVGNVKQYALTQEPQPQAYVSYQQLPAHIMPNDTESRVHKSLVIRARSDSATLIENVRRTIAVLAPDAAIFGVTTVAKTVSNSARPWALLSEILGLFAAMGLILAAIGIYGVISYSVSERSHELGLRMALGAQRRDVVRLVLRQAMTLSILGVIIGAAASFAAAPLLAEFLYGVKPHDVLTLTLVSSLVIAVSFLASYLPARRATLIDPMETLRHD